MAAAAFAVTSAYAGDKKDGGCCATHAKNAGADPRTWSYLTGTPAAIDHVTSRFGVSTIVETDAPTITHNLRTALVDPKGRLVTIHSGNDWTVDALLADLRDASGR